jgi:PAS domain S-box-containing protein
MDRFRATADMLPEPMLLVSVDGAIASANAAFAHVFGWTSSDIRRRSLLEFLAAGAGGIHSYLRHCAASRHLLQGAMEVRNRAGGVVACRVEGGLFRSGSSEGDPLVLLRIVPEQQGTSGFVGLTHRISEVGLEIGRRRVAEEGAAAAVERERQFRDRLTLSEAAERRASFLATAGAAIAMSLDYEEILSTIVHLAVPDLGDWCAMDIVTERGELRRLAVVHLDSARIEFEHPPQDDPTRDTHDPLQAVIRDRTPIIIETLDDELIRALARDDRQLEMLQGLGLVCCMCVPLAVHGRSIGALTFASARAGRYELADLACAQDLASRAAMAVENARAYDEARRANRLKDDFLATLSHELRTPLNAVLGYTRMLRVDALAPEKRAPALATIEQNASSMRQLVEDVLDVSRIEAGKIRLNIQSIEPRTVLQAAIATIAPAADAKGVRLDLVVDPHVPAIPGDPDRLQQIVWNLLSNALKFTGRGGRVQVQLVQSDANLEIEVSDTGAGIAREFLPHVFERFRQADGHVGRESGGLGLGLAITRHLVELHGGSIRAASAGAGQGTTFTVQLPLAGILMDPELDHVVAESADPPAPESLGDLSAIRVLAVDDDTDSLALLRQVLESAGAHVSTANSARHALEVLEEGATDVLLAELGMPEMDGFELVAVVRTFADPRVSGLPAVALTAHAPHDRMRTLHGGFQAHLSKPIHPAELTAAVLSLARRAGVNP